MTNKRKDYSDALQLVTDEQLRRAFRDRRELLLQKLADLAVDELLPEAQEWPEAQREKHEKIKRVIIDAIADIDRRLDGADAILRSFGGREEKPA